MTEPSYYLQCSCLFYTVAEHGLSPVPYGWRTSWANTQTAVCPDCWASELSSFAGFVEMQSERVAAGDLDDDNARKLAGACRSMAVALDGKAPQWRCGWLVEQHRGWGVWRDR